MPSVIEDPAERWRRAQEDLAVPPHLLAAWPAPDPVLEPERFRWRPDEDAGQPVRPSRRRALEALPEGGAVLDVGVGAGASCLGLVPRAGLLVGVDPLPAMLAAFEAAAAEAGVAARGVVGSWPEAAGAVEPADVVVCHHTLYRVVDIEGFVAALTARARTRVVVELSTRSPLAGLAPLWRSIHGLERPDWPVADNAEAVATALGLAVEREDVTLPHRAHAVTPAAVAFARQRLHAGPEHDAEIEAYLASVQPAAQEVAALWWPGAA